MACDSNRRMQTSVTVEKSVLLNGANIIAASDFHCAGMACLSLGFCYRRAYHPRSLL